MHAPTVSAVLLCAALAVGSPLHGQNRESGNLRLSPGDRILLEIPGEPLLAGEYTVDASGVVLMPIIGLVRATERDFSVVVAEVLTGFERELVDRPIRLTPLFRVAVLGEVRAPGLFWVDPTVGVSEVLAIAGGLTESAQRDAIVLQRPGEEVRMSPDEAFAVTLASRDRVVVGRRSFLRENGPLFIGATASVVAALVTSLILR